MGKGPDLLLLLIDKEPSNGRNAFVKQFISNLPPELTPKNLSLQVTSKYEDVSYIAIAATQAGLKNGFQPNLDKLDYRPFSTSDISSGKINGTIVSINK